MAVDNKRGPGAPKKSEEDKTVPYSTRLSKKLKARIDALPEGKRSKFVEDAINLAFAVLDGKGTFVYAQEKGDGEEILQDTSTN